MAGSVWASVMRVTWFPKLGSATTVPTPIRFPILGGTPRIFAASRSVREQLYFGGPHPAVVFDTANIRFCCTLCAALSVTRTENAKLPDFVMAPDRPPSLADSCKPGGREPDTMLHW